MSGQKSFKMADFSSVIIGCGRIGTFFDNPDSEYHFTHAKGYYLSENVELKGVFDINADSVKKAARLWKTESFTDLESMLSTIKPDIISICVQDEYHYEYLKQVAKFHPRAVITEKPLTVKYEDSLEIYELYDVEENNTKKYILALSNFIGVVFGLILDIIAFEYTEMFYILFSFISGVILYTIVREIIPEKEKGNPSYFLIGFVGFTIVIFVIDILTNFI